MYKESTPKGVEIKLSFSIFLFVQKNIYVVLFYSNIFYTTWLIFA